MKDATFDALAMSSIVRDYAAAFRDATGLSLTLIPARPASKRLALGASEHPVCARIATTPGGCAACHQIQLQAQKRFERKLEPQVVTCCSGLTVVAVPVLAGHDHLATLLGGQVFQQAPPSRRQFDRLARTLVKWGVRTDLRHLEQAYFSTRVVTGSQFKSLVQLLTIFAQHLADHANRLLLAQRGTEPQPVAAARDFVRAHAGGPISMRQTARHVHLSPVYFCKLFRKATGLTFTEYVARTRVEKVKNLLQNPATRISEAAYAAGFQSIPHFNRVFRKYAGQSPSAFRAAATPTGAKHRPTGA